MAKFTFAVLTASDKGSRGERQDMSGQVIRELVEEIGGELAEYLVIPDELEVIKEKLLWLVDERGVDLILTTGGTGLGPRDVTPDATLQVIDRLVPGIAEVMRMESLKKTSRAMLSRAVAGQRKRSLIINLPGSPKAVQECLEVILPALPHGIEIMKGQTGECARQ
ncbi:MULTISPECIES: molybdenum cofactor biosynthesis protein B [Carboxydocella]|uniref:Molybdopterin adenylyltransferase n=2 Tax=Carboxydocella TaxID=178898 RepID=A0A1T4MEU0_9FIRM|nr:MULTISPECIES: MogA/MoaB family molybdenum cofactor biosynthesis protein [Carboxydocella]AVX21304.1 molybdenum cofactor synthesis domain-containing protein [Carboxydocella thermautotrophica]AVX31735.1 molybdenum cofactor synthesis domain-containing protein [Carboxydocella thermautotrophica]SJZ65549.1 molybdopterin adenylyltransferase [Carboxydocella sporoproducens DSM 16521]GAW29348.1 cytoplasmic protein [Carboxydocella sp. ULO1]GAW30644.1 cytoplasmic protein [Carboxydocella sp. JDF658]